MLSQDTKERLKIALTSETAGDEVATAIDSGSNPEAASVAAFGSTTNISLTAPGASTVAAGSPTAAAVAAGTPAAVDLNPVFSDTEVETALDAKTDQADFSQAVSDLNTALDAKTDQADFSQAISDLNTALDSKSDQSAVSSAISTAETRLDNLESKINAILTALKNAGLMAP